MLTTGIASAQTDTINGTFLYAGGPGVTTVDVGQTTLSWDADGGELIGGSELPATGGSFSGFKHSVLNNSNAIVSTYTGLPAGEYQVGIVYTNNNFSTPVNLAAGLAGSFTGTGNGLADAPTLPNGLTPLLSFQAGGIEFLDPANLQVQFGPPNVHVYDQDLGVATVGPDGELEVFVGPSGSNVETFFLGYTGITINPVAVVENCTTASELTVFRGIQLSGALADSFESDDSFLSFNP